MKLGALPFALISIAGPAAAAGDPICASRPGKSTPSCTVAPHHWQVESSLADWSLHEHRAERETALTIAEAMVRIGLTPRSEVAFDVTPWQRSMERAPGLRDRADGVGDVAIYYKHRLTSDTRPVQAALMAGVKIPTARHALGNGKLEAAILLPVGISVGASAFSLNLTPELDWSADADGRGHHPAMAQVASIGWQANERLGISAELWGQWDYEPRETTHQVSADGSVAYLLSNDLQIDAGANFGLNRNTPDIEVYAGISRRF